MSCNLFTHTHTRTHTHTHAHTHTAHTHKFLSVGYKVQLPLQTHMFYIGTTPLTSCLPWGCYRECKELNRPPTGALSYKGLHDHDMWFSSKQFLLWSFKKQAFTPWYCLFQLALDSVTWGEGMGEGPKVHILYWMVCSMTKWDPVFTKFKLLILFRLTLFETGSCSWNYTTFKLVHFASILQVIVIQTCFYSLTDFRVRNSILEVVKCMSGFCIATAF